MDRVGTAAVATMKRKRPAATLEIVLKPTQRRLLQQAVCDAPLETYANEMTDLVCQGTR